MSLLEQRGRRRVEIEEDDRGEGHAIRVVTLSLTNLIVDEVLAVS